MYNLKGKKVLVTGGTGFVGGHLVEELVRLKARVFVVDINFDRRLYLFTEKLDKKCKVINLNICDYKKLTALVKKNKIEFIFHLAAQSLVEPAYKDPKATLDNNILSTVNVLEIARLNPQIKGVIVASSDKAYGDLRKSKYKESDPLAGDHPYETSKSATDLISTTYYKTYQTPVVVTRFGNIYGEGDLNFSRIVPGIMEAIAKNRRLNIRSNGKLVRDYLYVKDVVNGYILLAQHIDKVKGEAFNFGSKETLSVIEVVKTIEKALNKKVNYKILNIAYNEIPYQSLDFGKIRKRLGWSPRYSIKKTAKQILAWYRKVA